MANDLQKEVELFRDQAIWAQNCQTITSNLFDTDKETDKLLIDTAAWFFHDLSHILSEYMILLISRITDNANFKGNNNLSIEYLAKRLLEEGLMSPKITQLSNELNAYRKHIIAARNKIVSHADKATILAGNTLGAHPKTEMLKFFSNLQEYCDEVGKAVGIGALDFSIQVSKGDVNDLLHALRRKQEI